MFKLNKIHGHIKMLELEQLKLTRYLAEAELQTPRNHKREIDIDRALRRVTANIDMWKDKLKAFEAAPAYKPPRDAIGQDKGGPLIG